MSSANTGNWMAILSRLNSLLLKSQEWKEHLTPEALSTGWCGLPSASENEILRTERRLGIALPPSYRSFLSISNGWCPFDDLVERLLSAEQIDRFRSADPERLALLLQHYREDDLSDSEYLDYENPKNREALRHRYYPESILVGKPWGYESDIILLNPGIVFPDGEWEAIFFANWIPGNVRYRSFRDLIEASVNSAEASGLP